MELDEKPIYIEANAPSIVRPEKTKKPPLKLFLHRVRNWASPNQQVYTSNQLSKSQNDGRDDRTRKTTWSK